VEEKKGEKVIHTERHYGRQYRAFVLDQNVDEEKAEARYHDGVLELLLPKKQGGATRQLTVK
jgi:HSP20 family protein